MTREQEAALAALLEEGLDVGICLACEWEGESFDEHYRAHPDHKVRHVIYLLDADEHTAQRARTALAKWLAKHGMRVHGAGETAPDAIDVMEKEGCSCDLLYGVKCGIHETARRLRASAPGPDTETELRTELNHTFPEDT